MLYLQRVLVGVITSNSRKCHESEITIMTVCHDHGHVNVMTL